MKSDPMTTASFVVERVLAKFASGNSIHSQRQEREGEGEGDVEEHRGGVKRRRKKGRRWIEGVYEEVPLRSAKVGEKKQ